jgi:predicted nucleic acid-binding protein
MKVFAVIDTNVIVSALLARNSGAATVKVLEAFFQGRIMPLVNDEIINEYRDVCIVLNSVFQRSW